MISYSIKIKKIYRTKGRFAWHFSNMHVLEGLGPDWNSPSYLKIQTLAQAAPPARDTPFWRSFYLFPARRLEMVLFHLKGYQFFLRSNQICHLYFVNHKVCQSCSNSLKEANVMLMMQSCLKLDSEQLFYCIFSKSL